MCGICGFLLEEGGSEQEAALDASVRRMADTLVHRGPDAGGSWVDGAPGVALGHRRLSILDLSPQGAQPMVSACGRYVLVYNGEIYNFRELRAELEAVGHRFRGHSDTEVLVEAISRWGAEAAPERCDGLEADQFLCQGGKALTPSFRVSLLDDDVFPLQIFQLLQPLPKSSQPELEAFNRAPR